MNRKPLIWIVDDDPELRTLLQEYLEQQQFETRTFPHGRDVERRLLRERPDLLILDWMMPGPGGDGMTLCQRIRMTGDDVPIIMLTAKNQPEDRIEGIEGGADDYLGKPFVPKELAVRISAVLRRRASLPVAAPKPDADEVGFGDCRLDMATRTLWRDDRRLEMTSGEFALLAAFARNAHRPLTRERLLELARGPGSETVERSIDVQISRIRKLVEPDPSHPQYIQTVWGFGYVFVPDASE